MLRVLTIDAKPGMRLALPVFHPTAPGRVLLRAGYELDAASLARLRELTVRALWVAYPQLAFLLRYTSPEVIRRQAAVSGQIAFLFDSLRHDASAELEYEQYSRAVGSLVEALVADPAAAMFIDRISRVADEELEHAATVSYLSTLMGLKLIPYIEHQRSRLMPAQARDVTPLGVAGMLHDVGMVLLPEEARERFRRNPDPNDELYRSHVELGHKLVHRRVPPTVASAVLHHHQRFDGSGFPPRRTADGRTEPVSGEQIHIYARIIAVADAFDRGLTTADGLEQPRVRVLRRLVTDPVADRFDPMAVRALLSVCPPYPPGTMVTLSDGTRGVVIGWDHRDPCRPRIQPFDPDEPDRLDGEPVVDLMQGRGVCVAFADGQEVGRDNFYPESPAAYCLDTATRRLHNAAEADRMRSRGDLPKRAG